MVCTVTSTDWLGVPLLFTFHSSSKQDFDVAIMIARLRPKRRMGRIEIFDLTGYDRALGYAN